VLGVYPANGENVLRSASPQSCAQARRNEVETGGEGAISGQQVICELIELLF